MALLVFSLGAALLVWGADTVLPWLRSLDAYNALAAAREAADVSTATSGADAPAEKSSTRDWDALLAINSDVIAWVQVAGTSIDLPVAQAPTDDPDWYLSHDLWGYESSVGCPYLDQSCSLAGEHLLVYGHHLWTGGAFSDLQHCYEQSVFDTLGELAWETPDGTATLIPLCALRVTADNALVRRLSFGETYGLGAWLRDLLEQADASSGKKMALAASATRAISLVTCSSDWAGGPWRTVVVFVELPS